MAKKKNDGVIRDDKGRFVHATGRTSRTKQLRTIIRDAMQEEGLTEQEFLQSVVRRAEAGDAVLTKLLVELSWPKARPQMVPFDFGFDARMDVGDRATVVEAAAMSGKCSVDVALAMMQLLETKSRLAEFAEIMRDLRDRSVTDLGAKSFLTLIKGEQP